MFLFSCCAIEFSFYSVSVLKIISVFISVTINGFDNNFRSYSVNFNVNNTAALLVILQMVDVNHGQGGSIWRFRPKLVQCDIVLQKFWLYEAADNR